MSNISARLIYRLLLLVLTLPGASAAEYTPSCRGFRAKALERSSRETVAYCARSRLENEAFKAARKHKRQIFARLWVKRGPRRLLPRPSAYNRTAAVLLRHSG
jgi:hypothetical protein